MVDAENIISNNSSSYTSGVTEDLSSLRGVCRGGGSQDIQGMLINIEDSRMYTRTREKAPLSLSSTTRYQET